jgi:predicted HTH domain antitoxin
MARKITLELPDQLDMDEKELLLMLAAHLYGDGKLSMGRAAALAGVDKRTLMENLGRFGVPVFNYPPEDLENDIRHAAGGHQ